jgi:hypothetical protein
VTTTLQIGISVGAFVVGFFLGHLVARRGKALHIDWRLRITTAEGNPVPPLPDDDA